MAKRAKVKAKWLETDRLTAAVRYDNNSFPGYLSHLRPVRIFLSIR